MENDNENLELPKTNSNETSINSIETSIQENVQINNKDNKDKKYRYLLLILLFLFLFGIGKIYYTNNENNKDDVIVEPSSDKEDDSNKIEDAFMQEIKRLMKELYDKNEKEKIREILIELEFDEETIEEIIDDYDEVIEKITELIIEKKYTEPEVIDIIIKVIKTIVDPVIEDEPTIVEEPTVDPQNPSKEEETPSSTTIVTNKNLNIEFSNLKVIEGSSNNTLPVITNNKAINFNIILNYPGDYYAYTVDIKNNSSMDAQIDNVTSTVLTEEQTKYIGLSLTYEDGSKINKGDALKSGETKTLKFIALNKFLDEINEDDVIVNFNGQITFIQAE